MREILLKGGALVLAFAPAALAGEVELHGFVAGRGVLADAPRPWIEGGFGRFTESGDGDAVTFRGQLQASIDWRPSPVWTLHVHGVARGDPSRVRGRRGGVPEAFLQFRPELSAKSALRLRVGTLFPGTSRENTERLWSSPYTLTLSALNTWIAEEVRLSGIETALFRKNRDTGDELQLAAMVFGANDTTGTLLAWRGWTMGDRLATLGEVVPLPRLPALRPGGLFASQRDDGTIPLAELDNRPGWLARARWSRGSRLGIQAAFLDNLGDRGLHRGQYSWRTQFGSGGLDLAAGPLTLISEVAAGRTGMGQRPRGVDLTFRAGYLLASLRASRVRLSLRYDGFRNVDQNHSAESTDESGHAWTAALLWSPTRWVRLGIEGVSVTSSRGFDVPGETSPGQRRAQVESRFVF